MPGMDARDLRGSGVVTNQERVNAGAFQHFAAGGFCGVCGAVWPCATSRRSAQCDDVLPPDAPVGPIAGGAGGSDGARRRSCLPDLGEPIALHPSPVLVPWRSL